MIITGEYTDKDWYGAVCVDGRVVKPARSQRVMNHSPDGFAWGYGGSGPSQLALAILLEAGCSNDVAVRHHQAFKREFIEGLNSRAPFTLDIDVVTWVQSANTAADRASVIYHGGDPDAEYP